MPFSVTLLPNPPIIEAVCFGNFTLEDTRALLPQVSALARAQALNRVLMDDTGLTQLYSTLDLYDNPALFEQFGLPRSVRLAVVIPSEHRLAPDIQFLADVSHNRGWQIKTFADRPAAVNWLMTV